MTLHTKQIYVILNNFVSQSTVHIPTESIVFTGYLWKMGGNFLLIYGKWDLILLLIMEMVVTRELVKPGDKQFIHQIKTVYFFFFSFLRFFLFLSVVYPEFFPENKGGHPK